MALGSQSAEHGKHQTQVLNEHRRVLNAAAQHGSHQDLDQGDGHHQRQSEGAEVRVPVCEPGSHGGDTGHAYFPLPAR